MNPIQLINEFGKDKLNNAEHSDFHASTYKYLIDATAAVFNCTDAELAEYLAAQKAEEELIGRQSANTLTADISDADDERDALISYLFSLVDAAAKCPLPTQKKAGQEMQTILKPFRGVGRIALAQENTEVRSMIEKLNAHSTQVAAIAGVADSIAALQTANDKVIELMSQRTGSEQAKAEALAKRAITDDCYAYLVQRIDATLVLHPTDEVQLIVTEINNLITRTQNVYNTRMGVKHAKDENDL